MLGQYKYIAYGIIILIVAAVATTYVLMWKAGIRQQALLEFNNKQLEQVIKDNEVFHARMKELTQLQRTTIETLQSKNEELNRKLESLEQYLETDQAQKDSRSSSDVLKNTIRGLLK